MENPTNIIQAYDVDDEAPSLILSLCVSFATDCPSHSRFASLLQLISTRKGNRLKR
jgi:hypothetical protein